MGKIIKGWRRKTGLVTLLLALVFTLWWVRSRSTCDVICLRERNKFLATYLFDIVNFFDSDYVNVIASDGSSIHWIRLDRYPNYPFYATYPAGGDVLERMIPQANVSNPAVVVHIPYPAIVVPLALASAWLLLFNPRRAKFDTVQPLQTT